MHSLIQVVRNKFLEAIRSIKQPGVWRVLVVDDHSEKLVNSVLKQFDILEENVTEIESFSRDRKAQPEFEAIYIIMPTTQNIERIIQDFSVPPRYAAMHLFFIDALSKPLYDILSSSSAEPYQRSLKELFVNFWATEARVFTFHDPAQFFSLYSPPRNDTAYKIARDRIEEDLAFTSKLVTNVCILHNEFPYIRYYIPPNHEPLGPLKPHATTRPPPPPELNTRWRTNLARGADARAFESVETDFPTKLLAHMVQKNLEDYKRINPDFAKHVPGRAKSTLLITDRAMDMVAPFIHEFTYQAMVNDLLPIEDGVRYSYTIHSSNGTVDKRTSILSDSDDLWTEFRHMHMREAIDKIVGNFNAFLQEEALFKGKGAASINEVKDMLSKLPQFQQEKVKVSLHFNLALEGMSIFEKQKLKDVGNVEQCCATGLTPEGKTPKSLVEEMVPLLDSREVINTSKVRIIALYIQYRDGVPDEDRRRLYQHARLSLSEQDAVNSLVLMGVKIGMTPNKKEIKKKFKQKPNADEEYDLSRFKPIIKTIIEDHVADKLDLSIFPYVKDQPSTIAAPPLQTTSLRSTKPAWHRPPKPGQTAQDNREKLFVFIAGGITYSETREIYQLSTAMNKDIIIGSSHVITPLQFIDDLKVLELGGVGSKAIPNGLQDPKNGKRPYQEYYDERYYTKDPPPPAPIVAPRQDRKSSRQSPASSFIGSLHSKEAPGKEEKKKKKGILRYI